MKNLVRDNEIPNILKLKGSEGMSLNEYVQDDDYCSAFKKAKKNKSKLIREINEIIDDPDLHFWIKCKKLTEIETRNRPGCDKGERKMYHFFETCAGTHKDYFESAYIRPILHGRWYVRGYDYVNEMKLNQNEASTIGQLPRGIKVCEKRGSAERFDNYLKRKYPEAFEEFEEIKKVEWRTGQFETKKTEDYAWQHIFHKMCQSYYLKTGHTKAWYITTKKTQKKRRELDLRMEKAQADYVKLKKASGLPPRYLYNKVSLAKLQSERLNNTYAIYKGQYITTETQMAFDDSEVSFGNGTIKTIGRKILIRHKKKIVFERKLKTYSGNFVLNAIESHFGRVKNVKVVPELKPVQLNPKITVYELPECDGIRIFERLFSNVHYDYCALKDGITYHAESILQCMNGWNKKKELSKAGAKIINWRICRALGFCSEGLRSFCSCNNISTKEDYTVSELARLIQPRLSYNKAYYDRELQQLGII